MVQERRRHQRLAPSSPQLVLLDESKYSLLFDLSEGGLAVEGFSARDPKRAISLEFDIPEGSCCIQARAEIVWMSDSGYRTGFRFLDLSDTSRQQLRDWISVTSAARIGAIENEVAEPTFSATAPETEARLLGMEDKQAKGNVSESPAFPLQPPMKPRLQKPFAYDDEEFNSEGSALHLASIFVAAVVMSSIAFILGYYWRAGRPKPPVKPITTASQPFGRTPGIPMPSAPPQSSAQTAIPPMLPLDNPGFVLQVGAMGQEGNADVLSNELRKKNFSSFVFHRGTDPFYRVAVGPYKDQPTAIRIQKDLEQEGYKPILKPWSPQ
jgi:septal ring-binding cell division protein DamX